MSEMSELCVICFLGCSIPLFAVVPVLASRLSRWRAGFYVGLLDLLFYTPSAAVVNFASDMLTHM